MYPHEYILFLVHFHGDRDYFECHEILEEYWKKVDTGNKESIWVGLIQLAVSCYHHRRNNFSGAIKTLSKADSIFLQEKEQVKNLGLDDTVLIALIQERIALIEQNQAYQSFILPINDHSLRKICSEECIRLGYEWGRNSDMNNLPLVHRHIFRDRTETIKERRNALKKRKGSD